MKQQITPAACYAMRDGNPENLMAALTPGGIERQEKEGQIMQAMQDTLPRDGANVKQLEAMGFKHIGTADDIFDNWKFPQGWRKQCTDHSMWSNLLDDKERTRAAIFYKAAFYDRSAHMHMVSRYAISCYEPTKKEGVFAVVIKDGDNVIERFGESADYKEREQLEAKALETIKERWPNYKDASAYWD
jgi:hypothetical protein